MNNPTLEDLEATIAKAQEQIKQLKEPEFEYPIVKQYIGSKLIVEFSGLQEGVCLVSDDRGSNSAGEHADEWYAHNDLKRWQDCERPKWNPTEPTWCWTWNSYSHEDRKLRLITHYANHSYYCALINGDFMEVEFVEPCEEKDIPQWWKDMKSV